MSSNVMNTTPQKFRGFYYLPKFPRGTLKVKDLDPNDENIKREAMRWANQGTDPKDLGYPVLDTGSPRVENIKLMDSIQNFKVYRYNLKNVNTLEEYYKLAKSGAESYSQGATLKLYFKAISGSGFQFRTCKEDYLETYEDFQEFIEDVFKGRVEGSGGVNQNQYYLFLDFFDLNTYTIEGDGSADNILFHCKEFKDGRCWADCLDFIGGKNEEHNDRKYRNYDDFIAKVNSIARDKKINVNVISNSFKLSSVGTKNIRKFDKIKSTAKGKSIYSNNGCKKIVNRIGPARVLTANKLLMSRSKEISLNILSKIEEGEEEPIYIVYDAIRCHYDIITELEFNDIYLSYQNIVYRQKTTKEGDIFYDPIYASKQLNTMNQAKMAKYQKYRIYWDLETVIDENHKNVMIPYSISWAMLNEDLEKELSDIDWGKDITPEEQQTRIKNFIKKNCHFRLGYDCLKDFVHWMIENQADKRFELVSFNGSCFDNFLLLDYLLTPENDTPFEFGVNDVFYNGSSVLNMRIGKRHKVFDLARHVVGSLASNCEGFGVSTLAKTSFDHHHAQKLHDRGELIQYMTGKPDLEEYNIRDVLSLAIVYERYRKALEANPITATYSQNLEDFPTIGGLVWDIMKKYWSKTKLEQGIKKKKDKIRFPKLTHEQYRAILDYKSAGRVQLFNGVQKIEDEICSKDIASMYPYVMGCLDCYYPCGDIVETEIFEENKIGFYWCDIDQSILKTKNLPNIVARKEYIIKKDGSKGALKGNDWAYDKILENYCINSITIQHLRDNGCKVKIHKGFYFTDKIRSCDCFKPVLEIMGVKIQQDRLKKKKDPSYNPALREASKLCMNSVSGKVIEGLHLDKVEETDPQKFVEMLKGENKKDITAVNVVGTRIFASYKVDEEDELHKQRPVYLGALIYAYAQRHIYETGYKVIGLKDLVYTDTDSFKARASAFDRPDVKEYYSKAKVPVWADVHDFDDTYERYENKEHPIYSDASKVFGSYEEELDENDFSVFAQKKGYIIANTKIYNNLDCLYSNLPKKDKRRDCLHIGFKGVPTNSLMIDLNENFISKKTIQHADGKTTTSYIIEKENQKKAIDYFNENPKRQIQNNAIDFANKLYNNRCAFVLTTSFRKIVKTTKSSRDLANKIQVLAVLKKITINDE